MTQETLTAVKEALENKSLNSLFSEAIGMPEDVENEDNNYYALMFNVETDELFFLSYATQDNNWAKIAESQNPWINIGYVSATDIIMGDPASEIADRLDCEFEQHQQMENEYNSHS